MSSTVFESTSDWNLYGSSGNESVGGTFGAVSRDANGNELVTTNISITGNWPGPIKGRRYFNDASHNFFFNLPSIILSISNLKAFSSELYKCSDISYATTKNLCLAKTHQKFEVYIGPPDPRLSLLKTVTKIIYKGTTFRGEWSFGIDQSCVGIFAEELARAIASISSVQ